MMPTLEGKADRVKQRLE